VAVADDEETQPAPAELAAARQAEWNGGAAFLRGLVEALGEQADVTVVALGDDEAELQVSGGDLGVLIGPRGQTLIAVQDLTRLAAQRRVADRHGRLRVDIGGYRERRREALARFTAKVAAEVRASGASRALEPMSSMDRKVVHDAANELDGVETVSEGEEPFRRVVIRPAAHA
jgi:spoIIIJ-associated protein